MNPHLKNLSYVIRHKWYVWKVCRELKVGWMQALTHDWSKFLPDEWFAYARFFSKDEENIHHVGTDLDFEYAWNRHQKRQPHHWQYWVLIQDQDNPKIQPLKMPEKYVKEMVADWRGAGMAQGYTNLWEWYHQNRGKIILHPDTRKRVEEILFSKKEWR
jgi:hypothetical protein